MPSSINSFLLSALADSCIAYQLDDFKAQFVGLCDKGLLDEERFKKDEVKAWDSANTVKLIELGTIQTEFNLIATLKSWAADESFDNMQGEGDVFDSLMGEGGLLSNILYDEKTILENSVPVSSLPTVGRNDPCSCGSGKKYKKCCLQ